MYTESKSKKHLKAIQLIPKPIINILIVNQS